MSCQVSVNLGARSYPIHIEWGSLKDAPVHLESLRLNTHLFLVTHPELRERYGEPLQNTLAEAQFQITLALVPQGEESKSLHIAGRLYDRMVEAKLSRDSAVVALGGGVIGDLAGFVASTYMRGIRFIQIPTTLLSQVDASVGGKVAINHPLAKNLIGAFHQPSFVLMDPSTLTTLSAREIRAGLAEVVKYGVIHDEVFFDYIEDHLQELLDLSPGPVEHILRRSCEIKARVVEQDERETGGLRAILNFGHTIGHAIEAVSGYGQLLHGECVAIGMVAATRLAIRTGMCQPVVEDRLTRLLIRIGLPVGIPGKHFDDLLQAMKLDKKGQAGKIRLVLPDKIGAVRLVDDVAEESLRHSVESVMDSGGGMGP